MSNRFVSGGTIGDGAPEGGGEEAPAPAAGRNAAQWEAVQKELDEERQRREEQRRKAMTGEEKSLYEILQENKGTLLLCSMPHPGGWRLSRGADAELGVNSGEAGCV